MGKCKALLGREIVVHSVMPPKPIKKNCLILNRPCHLSFSWKSGKRKGALCEAFINEKFKIEEHNSIEGFNTIKDFSSFIIDKFKEVLNTEIHLFFECEDNSLLAKKLVGECTGYKSKHTKYSHEHGTNQTIMKCNYSSLCYTDLTYVENEKFEIIN